MDISNNVTLNDHQMVQGVVVKEEDIDEWDVKNESNVLCDDIESESRDMAFEDTPENEEIIGKRGNFEAVELKQTKRKCRLDKRKRAANFTTTEVETLVQNVVERADVLFGELKGPNKNVELREDAWASVQVAVNAVSPVVRSVAEIRKKISDLKTRTKSKVQKITRELNSGVSGVVETLTKTEEKLISIISNDSLQYVCGNQPIDPIHIDNAEETEFSGNGDEAINECGSVARFALNGLVYRPLIPSISPQSSPAPTYDHMDRVHVDRVKLNRSNLDGVHLDSSHLDNSHLDNSHLDNSHLDNSHLDNSPMNNAHTQLRNTSFGKLATPPFKTRRRRVTPVVLIKPKDHLGGINAKLDTLISLKRQEVSLLRQHVIIQKEMLELKRRKYKSNK